MRSLALFAPCLLLLAACGTTEEVPDETGCDACTTTEFCLVYFEDDGEREACAPIPAACDGDDSCECRGEMYDACEEPFFGVGCSDTFPPTLISCN